MRERATERERESSAPAAPEQPGHEVYQGDTLPDAPNPKKDTTQVKQEGCGCSPGQLHLLNNATL